MCGISAVVSSNKDNLNSIKEFTRLVKHRGPDAEGYYNDGSVALGHKRLRIIDISPEADQPMYYEGIYIVFNGEAYNYRTIAPGLEGNLKTTSDTEVILHAYKKWGEYFPSMLSGMFAIVIYDTNKNKIIAVRDRFGIKPLYFYKLPDGGVAFGSEIKQFTALPEWKPVANVNTVNKFATTGVIDHNEETMFNGVYQIKPGWMITLEPGGEPQHKQWYNLEEAYKKTAFPFTTESWYIKHLLETSVRQHLNADVPVGSCLSGGIDSSAIVCIVNQIKHNKQFTISARSHNELIDEGKWIDIVESECKDIERHDIYPGDELLRELPNLIWHQDSPISSTSMYAQWKVFEEASKHVKVLLDGQGSDEMFGGYSMYFGVRFATLFKQMKYISLIKEILQARSIPQYDEKFIMKVAAGAMKKYGSVRDYSLEQIQHSSLPALLHWEDRDSSAHSLEARVPFLDHHLVEAAVALPDNLKVSNGTTKVILREALKGVIPEEIRNRRDKIGFQTDEQTWIQSNKSQLDEYYKIADEWNLPSSTYWRMVALGVWIDRFGVIK